MDRWVEASYKNFTDVGGKLFPNDLVAVSYTHLRAHETVLDLVCRLLLEKKKQQKNKKEKKKNTNKQQTQTRDTISSTLISST